MRFNSLFPHAVMHEKKFVIHSSLFCPHATPNFSVYGSLARSVFGRVVCRQDGWILHEPEQVAACIAGLTDEFLSNRSFECLATILLMYSAGQNVGQLALLKLNF